ncbi:MAG: SRPBCC family protein [Nonlabens sp.]
MIESKQNVTVELPIDVVMELFQEQQYFKKWQKGLVSSTNITPSIGQEGSRRAMKIRLAGTSISMEEEITKVDLPHAWEAVYRSKGVVNYQYNRFRESEITKNNKTTKVTEWQSRSVFKFTSFMRLIGRTKPDLFKGQTIQFMNDFKTFAESKASNT